MSGGHLIDRTSPKGLPFVGTCRFCRVEGLTMSARDLEAVCPEAPTGLGRPMLDALQPPAKGER